MNQLCSLPPVVAGATGTGKALPSQRGDGDHPALPSNCTHCSLEQHHLQFTHYIEGSWVLPWQDGKSGKQLPAMGDVAWLMLISHRNNNPTEEQ